MNSEAVEAEPALRAWLGLAVVLAARAYRATLLTLVALAVVPIVWGWTSYVVHSASMDPSLAVGDVAVAKPIGTTSRLAVGRVMVFDDPTKPQQRLIHRVVERRDDGRFVTAGDANDVSDITPVPREAFEEQAALLVPHVGLPVIWMRAGQWPHLAAWLLVTVGAFALATPRRRRSSSIDPDDGSGGTTDEDTPGPTPAPVRSRIGSLVRTAVPVTVVGSLVLALAPVSASFTATSRAAGSTWTVGGTLLPYVSAVLADTPVLYWMLEETGGGYGADRSGNDRTAALVGIDAYGQPRSPPTNAGTAVQLGGGTDRIVAQGAPNAFSAELWFRRGPVEGGKLIGFESSQAATSSRYDRAVFIRDNGRLVYGARSSGGSVVIESPQTYQDNRWHHLVVTVTGNATSANAHMYVDGELVTAGPATGLGTYSGWWRVGYGPLPNGNFPKTHGLIAQVDNVAVYHSQLSAQRVAAHWAAR